MEKIKKCFCGADAWALQDADQEAPWFVMCKKRCGISTVYCTTKEKAIEKWNKPLRITPEYIKQLVRAVYEEGYDDGYYRCNYKFDKQFSDDYRFSKSKKLLDLILKGE